MHEKIEYKELPGYDGKYYVSSNGDVYSNASRKGGGPTSSEYIEGVGIKMKKTIDNAGYYVINLTKRNPDGSIKQQQRKVHRLIGDAFIDKDPSKPILNHLDGNKLNCAVSNLEPTTYSGNLKHAYDLGLRRPNRGPANRENNGSVKLSQKDFDKTMERIFDGELSTDLARELKMNRSSLMRQFKRTYHISNSRTDSIEKRANANLARVIEPYKNGLELYDEQYPDGGNPFDDWNYNNPI